MASENLHRIRIRSAEDVDKAFNTLLSVLREPALGEQIRHLEMDRSRSELRDRLPRVEIPRELEDCDKELLENAVRRAGFEGQLYDAMMEIVTHTPRAKERDLYHGGASYNPVIFLSQALAALIISIAPNLESFAFPEFTNPGCPPSESGLVLQAFVEHANAHATQIPYLQNLRTIRCLSNKDLCSDRRSYEVYDLPRSMKLVGNLPAVESLVVNAIDDMHEDTMLAPSSTNFKKIAIHHSMYSSRNLARIIRSCRRLEEFEFSIGGRSSSDGSIAGTDKVDLLNALSFHAQTLRVFDLDVDDEFLDSPILNRREYYDDENEGEGQEDSVNWNKVFAEDHQLPSLKDFPALKSLSIGIKFLAAIARGRARKGQPIETPRTLAEILPPNLEYLRIRGYNPGTDPEDDAHAASLIEMSRTHLLPKIVGLDVCIPNGKSVRDPDNHPELLWADEDWDLDRW